MIVKSDYQAPWWIRNCHLQTIWGSVFRHFPPVNTACQRLELDDGDFIDLEWLNNEDSNPEKPILLLLHGLEGSKDSSYMQGMLNVCLTQNWRGVVMHFRSCSAELNRLPRSYHSGETSDLIRVLNMLHQHYPDTVIMAAGFSLGGNVLLKYLGENPEQQIINYAVAVSVPFLLDQASSRMDRGFSRFYRNKLLRALKQKTSKKMQQHEHLLPLTQSELKNIRTFFNFDDNITAPLHGFSDASDYYRRCSSRQFLSSIGIPTLILHSLDDPFMTREVVPREDELSRYVTLELSDRGGHVGFISGLYPWQADSYLTQKIPEWFQEQLQKQQLPLN